jgi:hypothetical protein
MVSQMLIGQVVLTIENQQVGILCTLVLHLSHRNPGNNALLLDLLQKQNTKPWLMVLLKFCGFVLYWQNFGFPLRP